MIFAVRAGNLLREVVLCRYPTVMQGERISFRKCAAESSRARRGAMLDSRHSLKTASTCGVRPVSRNMELWPADIFNCNTLS